MSEYAVWLLISMMSGGYGGNVTTVVETFKTKEKCEEVLDKLPRNGLVRCVSGTVYR